MDTNTNIVIDNGSDRLKIGFSGEKAPSVVFPSVFGRAKSGETEYYFGNNALGRISECENLVYPVDSGFVENCDDLEKLWSHVFTNELKVSPQGKNVMVTIQPLNPSIEKENITSLLFEKFGVAGVYYGEQAPLSLLSIGKTTGMVIEAGDAVTHLSPVIDGKNFEKGICRLDIGGATVTKYLKQILTERGYDFTEDQWLMLKDIKEKLAYVSLDLEKEMDQMANGINSERNYELPDGQVFTIGDERIRAPEVLFRPTFIGKEVPGIHEVCYGRIMSVPEEHREALFTNILVSGGTSQFKGLNERLTLELQQVVDDCCKINTKVKLLDHPDRQYSVWQGASILANCENFKSSWITKDEFKEHGMSIISKKCCC